MDHSKKSTYLFSVDALRVIAILAVVMIHTTTKILDIQHFDIDNNAIGLFLNQAARFAVPLFFLISGFVLELNNKNGLSYLAFFKKRASRIVIPYLLWTSIYFYVGWNFNLTEFLSFRFLNDILFGSAAYHLYFIPTLIFFYLAFPFFHKIMPFLKNPYVFISIYVVQGVLLYIDYYIGQLPIHYDLRVAILSIAMFVTGMVASHHKDYIYHLAEKTKYLLVILLTALLFIIFIHIRGLTLVKNTVGYIYNQYSPLNYIYTLILSVTLFFFLEKKQLWRRKFIVLSKLSFFVFFIHVLILDIFWKNLFSKMENTLDNNWITNLWFVPLFFVAVSLFSFGVAYIAHKISWIPKITG